MLATLIGGATQAQLAVGAHLGPAAWDIKSLLRNGATQGKTIVGLLIVLVGVVGLGIAAAQIIMKFISSGGPAAQRSWGRILGLFLISGAFITGGWSFINTVSSGSQQTIEDLGNGTVIIQAIDMGSPVAALPAGD